jgi:hypothetical protein
MTADVAAKQDGLYVYCVARGKDHYTLGPIGLDSQRVYTLASGDLCAVVHDRQVEPYQSEDVQAVERWVLTHQRVVSTATEAFGTVLPMAFNMIVYGDENGVAAGNLTAWLKEKRDRFTHLLDKLAGKAEYGVQVFWEPEVITAALIQNDPELRRIREEARTKPRGLAYMLQQKLAKAARTALETRVRGGHPRRPAQEDRQQQADAPEPLLLDGPEQWRPGTRVGRDSGDRGGLRAFHGSLAALQLRQRWVDGRLAARDEHGT